MATRAMTPPARAQAVDRSVARLFEAFDHVPVAAVIRHAEDLPRALASQVPAVFFVRAPAFHLGPLVWAVQARGKMAFVHIDLIAGLGKDRAGVAFLAREIGVNGIITSHSGLVVAVRTPGLLGAMLPAIRDSNTLHQALDLGYRQLLVERGSLLAMVGPLAAAARGGVAIFVNLDAVEGLAADSAALAFVATDLGFSGVLSVKPHLLKDASRFRLRTIQRIHALDSTGLETGLNSVGRPAPYAIAIAPGVAIPQVMPTIRESTNVPVWGTGFITTPEQAAAVLAAGADVVASAELKLWREFRDARIGD